MVSLSRPLSPPRFEHDILRLTAKLARLESQRAEADRGWNRTHLLNEATATRHQIADLEALIAQNQAGSLADAAVQLRRLQVVADYRTGFFG